GSLVPWNQIPWDKLDLDEDDYKEVIDKLKGTKVTATLAVKGEYVLLSFGADSSAVARVGSGAALATRADCAPLAKFADRRVIDINYVSQKLSASVATTARDVTAMFDRAKEAMKEAPLSDALKEKIGKDLDGLAKEISAALPRPHAVMGFAFLTGHGSEGF